MTKYQPKTLAANVADKLMRALLTAAVGVGWFVWLWGLSLPALCAGLSLGALLWLCARLLGKKRLMKREQLLRRMVGGELALEALLTLSPREAAFRAAMWLAPKYPLELQQSLEWGILGKLDSRPTFLRLICQHESVPVTAQQLVEAVREARARKAEVCLLCATAPLAAAASDYAPRAPIDMRLIMREELIRCAGLHSPATDDDLRRISGRQKKRRSAREWGQIMLHPSRARRYLCYGAGMAALAFITGQWVYPVPAVVCLGLFAACKARAAKTGEG